MVQFIARSKCVNKIHRRMQNLFRIISLIANELNELNEFYYSQNRESSHVGRLYTILSEYLNCFPLCPQ